MNFINVAKAGVENFSQYGKFIGQGKNNGKKVYEKLMPDGRRVLTSVKKDGEICKTITKDKSGTTHIKNYDEGTFVSIEKRLHNAESSNPVFSHSVTKVYNSANPHGLGSEQLDRLYVFSESVPENILMRSDKLSSMLRNKSQLDSIALYQSMADGGTMQLVKNLPNSKAEVITSGNYKLTPEIKLEDGVSTFKIQKDGKLTHASDNNSIDLHLAQMFFDPAKKLWK